MNGVLFVQHRPSHVLLQRLTLSSTPKIATVRPSPCSTREEVNKGRTKDLAPTRHPPPRGTRPPSTGLDTVLRRSNPGGEAALGFGIGKSPSRVRNRLLGSYKHKNAAIGGPILSSIPGATESDPDEHYRCYHRYDRRGTAIESVLQ